jgi:ribosomal protein L35
MKFKLKTHKSAAKRFKITAGKKYIERRCTQDHFNSRDRGRDTTAKRRDMRVSKTYKSHITRLLPYA